MPTATATSFRSVIDTLQSWLTRHPHIPFDCVEYADDLEVELTTFSVPGGFEALIAIADAADALADPSIEVIDYDDKDGVACHLSVSGTTNGLTVTVRTVVINGTRRAFLGSLAARPLDEAVIWTTTAAHLRAVATTGGV